jgi:cell wall-associated NlpC family hydrolase
MSIESVMARISQIESAFGPGQAAAPATGATPSSNFASALKQASGTSAIGGAGATPAAAAPGSGPRSGAAVVAAANALDAMHLPYVYGGGHVTPSRPTGGGMDCSASVSWVLQHAGFNLPTMTSGSLAGWGEAGPGKYVTIYANAGHTFLRIGDRYFGTSGFGHPGAGTGAAWFTAKPSASYLAGFTQRHPPGL